MHIPNAKSHLTLQFWIIFPKNGGAPITLRTGSEIIFKYFSFSLAWAWGISELFWLQALLKESAMQHEWFWPKWLKVSKVRSNISAFKQLCCQETERSHYWSYVQKASNMYSWSWLLTVKKCFKYLQLPNFIRIHWSFSMLQVMPQHEFLETLPGRSNDHWAY